MVDPADIGASILAALLVIGVPWAAASYWVGRHVGGLHDRLEVVALGFAGVGVATWGLWVVATVTAPSPVAVVAVAVLGTAWLAGDACRAPARRLPDRAGGVWPVALLGIVFVLLLVPAFLSFGWERGEAVHTLAMTDWYKHLTVATEIAGADRFPPSNPYLAADQDPRYYFGFHLVAAAISRVAGTADVYPALLVLTNVVAGSVPLVFYAFARPFGSVRLAVLAAAAGLLAGFDVLVVVVDTVRAGWSFDVWPTGFDAVRAIVPSTQLDYWVHHNARQFNPFYVATAWAPQHVAAVLLALVVLSLVGPTTSDQTTAGKRGRSGVLLPAVALAATAALSAYVALSLACGVAGWLLIIAFKNPRGCLRAPEIQRWVPVGLLAGLLSLPMLAALWGGEGSATGMTLAVSSSGSWNNGAVWNGIFGDRWWTNVLDTPVLYTLELGVVGVLATMTLVRSRSADPTARQAVGVLLGILLFVTCVRPPVGEPNNLYARPMLLVYAMLTPFAVRAMMPRTVLWHWLAIGVCLSGTVYALFGLALQGSLFYAMPAPLANACAWVTERTPRSARVAVRASDYSRYVGFVCRRPLSLGDRRHARLFGASDEQFDVTSSVLDEAYEARTPHEAARKFAAVGADTVLVKVSAATSPPAWVAEPCFRTAYRNADWLVAARTAMCAR